MIRLLVGALAFVSVVAVSAGAWHVWSLGWRWVVMQAGGNSSLAVSDYGLLGLVALLFAGISLFVGSHIIPFRKSRHLTPDNVDDQLHDLPGYKHQSSNEP